jgi:uncharacterized protein with HEPN domain
MTDDDKDLRAHLEALLTLCEIGQRLRVKISAAQYFENEADQMSVSMLIARFGEASSRMIRKFPEFVKATPQLPFQSARGMRNRIVHDYEGVSIDAVWDTFDQSIPQFEKALTPIVQAFDAKHGTL